MKTTLRCLLAILCCGVLTNGFAQERETVMDAFGGTQLGNTQTTGMMPARSWSFVLQHRFGQVGMDSTFVTQFIGLDLPTTMRFAFGWSFNDRLYAEIGRTNHLKTYDLGIKYLALQQGTGMPVSVAVFANPSIRSERFPNVAPYSYFEDRKTTFTYKPAHRFEYNTQMVISRQFGDKYSLQVDPIFIYRNLVPAYYDNFTMVVAVGARIKTGKASALFAEYAYTINNRGTGVYRDPFALGMEFGTAGHTFQIFAGTSNKILENHIYAESATDISKSKFCLGFNMKRSFWRK